MLHKINHLENKFKKMSGNLQFLHFVLKKIVSLQLIKKSSVFCYKVLSMKCDKFQKGVRKSDENARSYAGAFICSKGIYHSLIDG